jgi:heat shock protein HslJ
MKGLFFTAVLITAILISCSSAPKSAEITDSVTLSASEMAGNELTGKGWKLTEVRINNVNTGFNRKDLPRIGLTAVGSFTLIFDAETINGVGAPNRYIAPYTRTGNQISISLMATTKMATFSGLDEIKEQEYFIYLQNANSWNLVNDTLELHSKTADGKAVILIFSL